MSDSLAQEARFAMARGDLRPMAKWLRTQNDATLLMLAMEIESGHLTLKISHKARKAALWLEVGKWIEEQEALRDSTKEVIADAVDRFSVSKRTAERCKENWEKWGKDGTVALQFLIAGEPS